MAIPLTLCWLKLAITARKQDTYIAFAAANQTDEPRSFSIGPWKLQLLTFSAVSGDTTGTITADRLGKLIFIQMDGLQQNAQPTYSGNTATIAFNDPVATVAGQILCFGR